MTQREIRRIAPTLLAIAVALILATALGGRYVPPAGNAAPQTAFSEVGFRLGD